MSFSVKFENNFPKYKNEWKERKKEITYAWGLKFISLASKIITRNGIVNTGRLRASLSFITIDKSGSNGGGGQDVLNGSSGNESDLIVGSNVKYAAKQELENKKGPFIRPSITDYREDYKNIAKSIMNKE